MSLRILRRADGFAEPEIDQAIDNCSDGLQHFAYLAQNSNITKNHMDSGLDFDFGNSEFTYGIDGENTSNFGERWRARRERKLKLKEKNKLSKIKLRDSKAQAKIMKAGAKQTKAGAKETQAQAQVKSAEALAKQPADIAIGPEPMPAESQGMDPKTKKMLMIGGGLLLVAGIGAVVYFKFIKKKGK